MLNERIRMPKLLDCIMSADQAVEFIKDGMTVGFSGFTHAGDAKVIPAALVEKVKHVGQPFHINVWTGASVSGDIDTVLSEAGIAARRLPFQSDKNMRNAVNRGEVMYIDQHLSHTSEYIRAGFLGNLDVAVIEAVAITEEGGIVPSTSVGNSATFAMSADKVIVELNLKQSPLLEGIHDIYVPGQRPNREPFPLRKVDDRMGTPYIPVNPDKIVAIVVTELEDKFSTMTPPDEDTMKIAGYFLDFLEHEIRHGRMTESLRPLQSGVGSVANAVLTGMKNSHYSNLDVYAEVLQDAVFELIDAGKVRMASASSISLSPQIASNILERMEFFRKHFMLRPQEISNHPEIIRRLGIIAMNTALEADIYGNVNSTHVMGTKMMNGIGGSGDFARNAYLSIFVTKSIAKNGDISSIVPMVSHVDHTEHDVSVIITEQGLADLRGLAPRERAKVIIENCVHPIYRDALRDYYKEALKRGGQTPHILEEALSWHINFMKNNTMRQEVLKGSC